MAERHEDLVGLSDRDLLLRAGDATHQHYKGGLYRLLGAVRDADTGCVIHTVKKGRALIYEHVYPHTRELWTRSEIEFHERLPDGRPRFRQLNAGD